jgi:hypothetical protein
MYFHDHPPGRIHFQLGETIPTQPLFEVSFSTGKNMLVKLHTQHYVTSCSSFITKAPEPLWKEVGQFHPKTNGAKSH